MHACMHARVHAYASAYIQDINPMEVNLLVHQTGAEMFKFKRRKAKLPMTMNHTEPTLPLTEGAFSECVDPEFRRM